jgi:ADP-ribose pyrophosphatase YjhB (NUDIX family)
MTQKREGGEMTERLVMTVCYVVSGLKVLLGLKKVRIGAGLWNGPGGHVEPGETIGEAAVRETGHECGLLPLEYEERGVILITWEGSSVGIELHLFVCTVFMGELRETDEMIPQWFLIEEIPYGQMWPADCYYLPLILAEMKCVGHFHLDAAKKIILSQELKEVSELPDHLEI